MITVGVDLAAEPAGTALATIEWTVASAIVRSLARDVDDVDIVDATAAATRVGIDCPLGWPDEFLEFLQQHHTGNVVAPEDVAGKDWRRRLAYRATDRAVRRETGVNPLSVAADRIGLTAMRAASLLSRLAAQKRPVDRAGSGVVVEVYPAASLQRWGLPHKGYKRKEHRDQREILIASLQNAAPWLHLGPHARTCVESDDALDAVIAALTARAAALSRVTTPESGDELHQAKREGWIALPTTRLDVLLAGPP